MAACAGLRRPLTLARNERLRVVSNRLHTQQDNAGSDLAGTSYTRLDGRMLFQSPRVPVRDVRVLCRGGQMPSGPYSGESEADAANDVSLELALEVGGALQRVQRGGLDVWTLGASERNVLTDPNGLYLPPQATVYARWSLSIPSSGKMHRPNTVGSAFQIVALASNNAASQVGATGGLSGGNAIAQAWTPNALVGEPLGAMQAVGWLGMSITGGTSDVNPNASGNYGYIAKGLDLISPAIPRLGLSRGSSFMTSFLASAASRMALAALLDVLFVDFGTNDIVYNSATLASLQAQIQQVWALARVANPTVKLVACTVIPRVSSTDGYVTPANQTPLTGFASGGLRDQFNAWLDTALTAGLVDGLADTSLGRYRLAGGPWIPVAGGGIEDPGNPGKFRTDNGAGTTGVATTGDGAHPNGAAGNGYAMMALVIQAIGTALGLGVY